MIKRFKHFNISEAIIKNEDFSEFIEKLRSLKANSSEWNRIAEKYNTIFVDYETFYDVYLEEGIERDIAPKKSKTGIMDSYIQFALYHYKTDKMVIVCTDDFFTNEEVEMGNKHLDLLEEILEHESVHREQAKKSLGKSYSLGRSPSNRKEYFSHYSEVMAYANSLVHQLKKQGINKEEMLSMAKSGEYPSWINNVYNQMDADVRKKFTKYVISYIEEL